MPKTFHLEIITPERIVFSQDVNQITLPTLSGEITILPNHLPLISSLNAGELKIVSNGQEIFLAISSGLIQVNPNSVKILADTAERAEEIDEARAEAARLRAQTLLKEKRAEAVDYTALSAKIDKELARLKVVRRRRQRTPPPSVSSEK